MLVDGTFIVNALREKILVKEALPKMLGAKITPATTGCVLAELRSFGDRGLGAAIIAKGFYRVKCPHINPISASKCVREQIGADNFRKFIVATQDLELSNELRRIPGVPLIRMTQQVPFLEVPSFSSRETGDADLKKREDVAAWEHSKLPALKQRKVEAEVHVEAKAAKAAKKRGPKGVNPLSCKKSKKRKEAIPAYQELPAIAAQKLEPPKPKRVRSRRMGTRTRTDAEELVARAASSSEKVSGVTLPDPKKLPAEAKDASTEPDEGVPVEPAKLQGVTACSTEEPPASSSRKKRRRRK